MFAVTSWQPTAPATARLSRPSLQAATVTIQRYPSEIFIYVRLIPERRAGEDWDPSILIFLVGLLAIIQNASKGFFSPLAPKLFFFLF